MYRFGIKVFGTLHHVLNCCQSSFVLFSFLMDVSACVYFAEPTELKDGNALFLYLLYCTR